MAIHVTKFKMSFFNVPKCASSTLRHFFFEVENGFVFRSFTLNGKKFGLNTLYGALPFEQAKEAVSEDSWTATLVRDPMERVVSCYRNRVVAHKVLEKAAPSKLVERGLSATPDLANFIERLEDYQAVSFPVLHHSRKLSHFLGDDPSFYHKIYGIDALKSKLAEDVRKRTKRKVPDLGWLQTAGPDMDVSSLTSQQKHSLKKMFEQDYDLYGSYF